MGLYSTTVTITNKCKYTVWPAILSAAGSSSLATTGFVLVSGNSKTLPVPPAWSGQLWGRTLCFLDTNGKFSCVTGDCGTSTVECAGGNPKSPVTLVEFDFNGTGHMNLYDISLVEGFNLPVRVASRGGNCSATDCSVDLNAVCPTEHKVIRNGEAVACKSTCQTEPCSSSLFFKTACSGVRVYAHDHGFFTCSSPHYTLTFCPTSKSWRKAENKKEPSGKNAVKYTGVLAVIISVICGFIIFRIRLRLSNRDWEISLSAGTTNDTAQC
ncbi:thaumatin-like protein 1 [Vigna unguiculata]|uniref:thaumatin-like protein 1 n=1 Tax=Vigna unguiculata TaxID=3917 RepID=UPI0010161283|nr:thaumatin-like protein 1 [Vigna unguiculata]